jgi:PKD repeat protein
MTVHVDFEVSSRVGEAPHSVVFIDNSTGTGIVSRMWDFGDGYTYNSPLTTFSYTYETEGLFTVSLTVEDSDGTGFLQKDRYIAANPGTPVPSMILAKSDSAGEGKYWNFYLDIEGHLVFENEVYTHRSSEKIMGIKKWTFVQFNPGPNKMYVGDSTRFIRELNMITTLTSYPEQPLKKRLYSSLNSSFVVDELKIWYGDRNLTDYFNNLWGRAGGLSL